MTAASQYWNFVRVDNSGKCRTQEIEAARNFLLEQFPELTNLSDVSKEQDREIQNHLIKIWPNYPQAEVCLRCFISNQIREYCLSLEKRFGAQNSFTLNDLFPIVLDDVIQSKQASTYQSLATEILQKFNPNGGGSLSTWISWIVKCHPPLKDFLLQHGIYVATDWGILNKATPNELECLGLTLAQLQQDKLLLENYHAVYRQYRLQAKVRGKCQAPTLEQLQQIANLSPTTQNLSPEKILKLLQSIALRLREYRIAIKSGKPPVIDLENLEKNQTIEQIPDSSSQDNEEQTFLRSYAEIIQDCLHKSVAQVIRNRVTKFQKKKTPKHQQFLRAMALFHQGVDMGEIAPQIGYKEQYQVSRLLKLKEFRNDVGQQILVYLKPQVKELARFYTSSEKLQSLELELNEILNEEVGKIIQDAQTEADGRKTRNCQFNSRFADAVRECVKQAECGNMLGS